MKYPRRLLLLEDAPDDAELLRRHISAEWPACEVVTARARADFEQALRRGPFDLILSDYVLPAFGGLAALGLARQICAEVPFLFVSGAIGDEVAVLRRPTVAGWAGSPRVRGGRAGLHRRRTACPA